MSEQNENPELIEDVEAHRARFKNEIEVDDDEGDVEGHRVIKT